MNMFFQQCLGAKFFSLEDYAYKLVVSGQFAAFNQWSQRLGKFLIYSQNPDVIIEISSSPHKRPNLSMYFSGRGYHLEVFTLGPLLVL